MESKRPKRPAAARPVLMLILAVVFISVLIFAMSSHSSDDHEPVVSSWRRKAEQPKSSKVSRLKKRRKTTEDPAPRPVSLAKTEGVAGFKPGTIDTTTWEFPVVDRAGLGSNSSPYPPLPRDKRRLIFVISTGHTGTAWLAKVLKTSNRKMTALHEAKPSLVSFHLLLLRGKNESAAVRRAEKWDVFDEAVKNATAQPGSTYADISHMMIKSWMEIFLEWLHVNDPTGDLYSVEFIVLRRHLPIVVRSYLTDAFTWNPAVSLVTWSGGEYTLHQRHYAVLEPLGPHGTQDSIDMIIGYLIDMEEQYIRFRRQYPSFRYYDFRSEEIFTPAGAERLLRVLDLMPYDVRTFQAVSHGGSLNPHTWRCPELQSVPTEAWMARIWRFIKSYRAKGVYLPPLPHLHEVAICTRDKSRWCPLPANEMDDSEIARLLKGQTFPNNRPAVDPACPKCVLAYEGHCTTN